MWHQCLHIPRTPSFGTYSHGILCINKLHFLYLDLIFILCFDIHYGTLYFMQVSCCIPSFLCLSLLPWTSGLVPPLPECLWNNLKLEFHCFLVSILLCVQFVWVKIITKLLLLLCYQEKENYYMMSSKKLLKSVAEVSFHWLFYLWLAWTWASTVISFAPEQSIASLSLLGVSASSDEAQIVSFSINTWLETVFWSKPLPRYQ